LKLIESEVRLSHAVLGREDRLNAEQDFTPNTVLFLATVFGHTTMLCDVILIFFHQRRWMYWGFAAAMILILDSISVAVTTMAVGRKVITMNDVDWMGLWADDHHRR
jgi:hypothetical protein